MSDERLRMLERLSKDESIDGEWEILSDSKFAKQKKKIGQNNLISTVPENQEKKKSKQTEVKSQLRMEYKMKTDCRI
jgi:hypothetical protein